MNATGLEINLNELEPVFPEYTSGKKRELDYLGWAPCPFRTQLRQQLHAFFKEKALEGLHTPEWFMPNGCHEENVYDDIWQSTQAAELPGLISEVGYGDILKPSFISKWVNSGVYAPLPTFPLRAEFEKAGFRDPTGTRHTYAVMSYVILVDLARLGTRAVPQSWGDLLNPCYHKDIIVSGWEDDLQESQLFYYYKNFGEGGLTAFGSNIKDFSHPAEMIKAAGTENPKGAALYIVPWFFAKSVFRSERTLTIWPKEGALAAPLYIMKKGETRKEAALPLEYLTSSRFAVFLDKAGFPASNPSLKETLPGGLTWPGWDWIYSKDLEELRPSLNAAAMKGRKL